MIIVVLRYLFRLARSLLRPIAFLAAQTDGVENFLPSAPLFTSLGAFRLRRIGFGRLRNL
jgi:hypothetical protein